jgi:eukaryotic-like serine/threonine-protein kinase
MSLKKFLFSFSFVKQVFLALLFVVVFLYLFMYWLNFTTNHGEEIVVPNISRMSVEAAEEKLDELNLSYELLDTVDYNPNYPKNSIVQQDPSAGEKVKENRVIYIKLNSSGYSKVRVPDLVQKTYRQAVPTLKAIGLEVGEITYVPDLGKDMVLEMKHNGKTIAAGERVLKMSKIDLVLGDGKVGFNDEELTEREKDSIKQDSVN